MAFASMAQQGLHSKLGQLRTCDLCKSFPLLQIPSFVGYDVDPLLKQEVFTLKNQVFQKIPLNKWVFGVGGLLHVGHWHTIGVLFGCFARKVGWAPGGFIYQGNPSISTLKGHLLWMVAKSISHQLETMVETTVPCYLQGNHPKPGPLRRREMDFVTIHSMLGTGSCSFGRRS